MLFKIRNSLARYNFNRSVREVVTHSPISFSDEGFSVLSQIRHSDVLMYLAAIKSFSKAVPVKRAYIVDDGSLLVSDKRLLQEQLSSVILLHLSDFQIEGLPTGGTWERLIAIAKLSQDDYIVQLDADTLTLGSTPEILEAWKSNRSFAIATWDNQQIETAEERSNVARTKLSGASTHVQIAAEAFLDSIRLPTPLQYIRGCSGFAGFAPSAGKLEFIKSVSSQMGNQLGKKWDEWGSEQVMSNILVANLHNPMVLPHPKYADCTKMRLPGTEFVHFIGPCRFDGGYYAQLTRKTLNA